MKRISKSWLGWGVGVLLTLFAGIFALLGPVAGPLERFSFDLPLPGHDTHTPTNAVLVYLDDKSMEELKQPFNRPLIRTFHAELLERLRRDGARLIVFDFLFHDPDPTPAADAAFLAAIGQRRDVVIASKQNATEEGTLRTDEPVEPLPTYQQAAAAVGMAKFDVDGDQGVRRLPRSADAVALTLAAAALQALGTPVPTVRSWYYLHYFGPPHRLPSVLYADALMGRVQPDFFRDKVVFVGFRSATSKAGASGDMFVTPFTRDGHTGLSPGVSIHATAFLNLMHQEWFTRAPGWVTGLLLLALVAGAAGLSRLAPLLAVLVGAAGAALLVVAAFVIARAEHVWFPWAALLVPLSAGVFWTVVYNGYRSHLERQLLRQSIGKHLSPSRVNQILQHPEALRPGGEMREVSLMFTDIAGFSKVAQRKHPEDLVKLLNGYYEEAIAAVHAEDGVIMDLIGDSIFALWNAPETQADHGPRACRTALALHEKLLKFDQTNEGAPLRTRVGLHRGTVCVGNVGSSQRFDYTAIGDAVNLASRLEGLNKHLGTDILATRDVQRDVQPTLSTRLVGQFRFKGFDKVVEVYELLGPSAPEAAWLGEFRKALHHFQRRAWDEAEAGFRRVEADRPAEQREGGGGDGPSAFYLRQIEILRAHPPDAEWLGEVDLREK